MTKTTPSLASPEARDAEIIANAVRYTASLFLGRGKYASVEATSREAIEALAADLKRQNPKATSLPIITAIDEGGNQATVNGGQPRKAAKRPAGAAMARKRGKAPATAGKAASKRPKGLRAAPAASRGKPAGKRRAEILADAERGVIPEAPNFSAETHRRFRGRHAELVALVEKGDVRGLRRFSINAVSSSPKALLRYRDLAVRALDSGKRGAKAARAR